MSKAISTSARRHEYGSGAAPRSVVGRDRAVVAAAVAAVQRSTSSSLCSHRLRWPCLWWFYLRWHRSPERCFWCQSTPCRLSWWPCRDSLYSPVQSVSGLRSTTLHLLGILRTPPLSFSPSYRAPAAPRRALRCETTQRSPTHPTKRLSLSFPLPTSLLPAPKAARSLPRVSTSPSGGAGRHTHSPPPAPKAARFPFYGAPAERNPWQAPPTPPARRADDRPPFSQTGPKVTPCPPHQQQLH